VTVISPVFAQSCAKGSEPTAVSALGVIARMESNAAHTTTARKSLDFMKNDL
jgi:hypothetical protein